MALTPGTRVGVYEVAMLIGAGGMGEVYRAHDTTLSRDVALKVLPAAFTLDPDRLARFKREAQLLASLNHSNIAAIYGFEESNHVQALVLELIEGPTLAEMIDRAGMGTRAFSIEDALPIARQIAEALEAAHEQGIVHRDLKPANIKLRPDGTVKVLDFGLAKALEPAAAISGDMTASPTITSPAMTRMGVILGTAAYMSPEQAKGRAADKRSDVWAFGAVLYEMLSGHRAFKGDDIADTLAAVLRQDVDWSVLPASTPASVRQLMARCLDRDVRRRLRDIGEARIVLDDPAAAPGGNAGGVAAAPQRAVRSNRVAWLVAACSTIALIATGWIALRPSSNIPSEAGATQFTIPAPDKTSFGGPSAPGTGIATQLAVSPNGRQIVFVAGAKSAYQIWLRPVATLAATPIPGTEGGTFPFWSPDSRFIGFFAAGKLKKVAIAGGPPTVLCDATGGRGGSWSRDNVILFAPLTPTGLLRVSSAGGVPTVVTKVDPATGEDNHRWPHFLPDGRHFFYTAITGACCPPATPSTIRIASLDPAEATITLLQAESPASYGSGHLLFARDDTLMAQPFDPDTRQPTGDAVPLAEHVRPEGSRYVAASLSANGTLVYASDEGLAARQLTWFDRTGRTLGTLGEAGPYNEVALSPDESRLAVALGTGSPENLDIWIIDIARNVRSRVTTDPGADASPVWSTDGTHIAFDGQRSGKSSLRQQLVNGTGADELLLEVPSTSSRPCGEGATARNAAPNNIAQCSTAPSSWSTDGRFIAFTLSGSFPRTRSLWILPLFGERKSFSLSQTGFLEGSGKFSPDGRWIAYTTDEPGQSNVYVQPFPRAGGKYRVSRDGGHQPLWRADGKEVFFLAADGMMMAAPIDATGQPDAGAPQALFQTGTAPTGFFRQLYAVTKDGKRFLVNAPSQRLGGAHLTVVVNWTAAIQQ